MLAMVKLVFECIKWVISTINNDPQKHCSIPKSMEQRGMRAVDQCIALGVLPEE
jgi:hypothetical protein